VTGVAYVDGDPTKGALITIENKGQMILPVIATITQSNGRTETLHLPVNIWYRGGSWTFKYASETKIDKVVLDPDQVLPDVDRGNNQWGK
jgi:hypothetical protein